MRTTPLSHPSRGGVVAFVLLAAGNASPATVEPATAVESEPARDCRAEAETTRLHGVDACLEEIGFQNGTLELAGRWFTPTGVAAPVPAVIFVTGSGPSYRSNAWSTSVAAPLLAAGFGVLIPDKRGSDRSGGDWRAASLEDLASDTEAAVRFVLGRPEVDRDAIGVLGLSQGGRIVPIVAARTPEVSFVVNVAGGSLPLLETVRHEMVWTLREAGLEGGDLEAATRMLDVSLAYVEGRIDWDEYSAELEATRARLGDRTDEFFIAAPDHWRWDFFRDPENRDPAPWWRMVWQPVLVLYGGADRNQPAEASASRLERLFRETGHPDATVRLFPDLGHSLWDRSGPMEEHGLADEAARVLVQWSERVLARR